MTDSSSRKADFNDYFNQAAGRLKGGFDIGEKVSGKVVAIDRKTIFVDVHARSEGIVDREEFIDENGALTVAEGDMVDVYFAGAGHDELRFTTRFAGGGKSDASMYEAYEQGVPVEGRVESERTGGFEVKVGSHSGFCPYSQIDIYKMDAAVYLGQKFLFKIIEYDEHANNMVLSRRELLNQQREQQKEQLQKDLVIGDVVSGTVTKLMPFGAFVDLGGTDGLIPISELAWGRTEKTEDVVSVGDKVQVLIRDIDWAKDRISLSLRQAQGNPWQDIEERYAVAQRLEGKVTKLMPFGAFVELEPGVEGLVHISKLGAGRRIGHPKEVVAEGDIVEVSIEQIDVEQKRISLSMEQTAGVDTDAAPTEPAGPMDVGALIEGTVESVTDFGVFISLPGGQTGLLHVSQVDIVGRDRGRALMHKFPAGDKVKVVIREKKGDRISLTVPEKWQAQDETNDIRKFMAKPSAGNFGNLGDAFDNLKL